MGQTDPHTHSELKVVLDHEHIPAGQFFTLFTHTQPPHPHPIPAPESQHCPQDPMADQAFAHALISPSPRG